MSVSIEMPKYQSHKQVWALKIKDIAGEGGKYFIIPEDERYERIEVNGGYLDKHNPKRGGYYVVYEDGYKSFSPASSFESGYSLIN